MKKVVLDIPDAALLAVFNLEELIQMFCISTGVEKPDIICLPLYDEGGPQFDSKFASKENSLWSLYRLDKEVERIRKKYSDIHIYFSFMPTLPGIKASHLRCRNQYGEETTGVCFVNPYAQEVILDIIIEATNRFQPNGIVFDLVDIHGQNSKGLHKPVDVSCFCNYCKESMNNLKFDASEFSKRISPFNLVLSASDTGIRFITPKAHFSPEQLVDLAIKEEYVSKDDEQTRNWAQIILDYIKIRSKVTGIAVGELRHGIQSSFPDIRVGAIINTASFDWTGGTDLHGLTGQVDEVWLDIEELSAATAPPGIEILAYAADRARYRIDAFFEFASDKRFLEAAVGREGIEGVVKRLNEREGRLRIAQNLNKLFVNSIQKMEYITGFVGIPQDSKIYKQIFQKAISEISNIIDIQQKPLTVSKDTVKQYIAMLVQYREDGNELTRREIVGLAAQLELLD